MADGTPILSCSPWATKENQQPAKRSEKRKFLRKSQLRSQDFAVKLFCNVEFRLERLPKLSEPQPEFERPVAAMESLLFGPRPSDYTWPRD
jgi:hypothetical protein